MATAPAAAATTTTTRPGPISSSSLSSRWRHLQQQEGTPTTARVSQQQRSTTFAAKQQHRRASYVWAKGDGNDKILDFASSSETDQLIFSDVTSGDVSITRSGVDLNILINSTGDVLTDRLHFSSDKYGMEEIAFADGVTWDRGDISEVI